MLKTIEEVLSLEKELYAIAPCGEDGMFGTDGSHESLMDVFENAWGKTYDIALLAIEALKDKG